jgi:transcriptional regulator with XRE-family HTH domain
MPGMAKKQSFSDSLRAALNGATESRYQISKTTGISQAQLSRFLHGQCGLTLANLDLLCDYLGVRVIGSKREKGD